MNCTQNFATNSEFRVYRNDVSNASWDIYLYTREYSGTGRLEITSPKNSIDQNVFTFNRFPVATDLLPTTPYIIPVITFIYDAGLLKTDNVLCSNLKLGAPTEMTYTTMTASGSTQVGYIISARSTATTAITTSLSNYLCTFQLSIGVYQFNCNIELPPSCSGVGVNVGIYIDNIENFSVYTITGIFYSSTFSFAFTNNSNNNNFGIKCKCLTGSANIPSAFIQAIRIS